jgi:hypothetical protein
MDSDDGIASTDPVDPVERPGSRLSEVTRRTFLRGGAAGVGLAAAAASVPGIGGWLQGAATDAPAVEPAAADLAPADLTAATGGATDLGGGTPLVAHITDLGSGRVSLYVGEREIITQDPELVSRLLRAAAR